MAGGNSAVFKSKEGAEDSSVNSQKDLNEIINRIDEYK